jgi:zinc transport system permease protein
VLVSRSGGGTVNVVPYLFGSILTVTRSDVRVVAAIGGGVLVTIAVLRRWLMAIVVDEDAARVAGVPVGATNALLAVLTSVTVVAAMRVVGILLVAALMVLPVATSRVFARSFRATVGWSVLVGIVSVVLGLAAARAWDLAPGGSIVLTASALFGLATLGRTVVGARAPA